MAITDSDGIRSQVREYLLTTYLAPDQTLDDDADLLLILNSLQVLRMVMEIESMFGVSVGHNEMAPENLGTIDNIVGFVSRKKSS